MTALANDVGFDLVFSRQIIAHARPGDMAVGYSTSGDSVNVGGRSRKQGPARAHHRPGRLRRRRHGQQPRRRLLPGRALRQRPSHPGGPGRLDVPAVVIGASTSVDLRRRAPAMTDVARPAAVRGGREAAVFERIEAFRRRRPRLLDEVVTLAHGAGGKASAALLDAVFLPAFANDALAAQTDAAVLSLPVRRPSGLQHRLLRGQAAAVPGRIGRPPGRARHRQRPRHDGRPPPRPVGRVRAGGGFPDRRRLRRSWRTWPRPRPAAGVSIVTGDTKVVDHGAADGLYISTAGIGCIPAGCDLSAPAGGRGRRGDLFRLHRRPRHGGAAGPGRPGPGGRDRLRYRVRCTTWSPAFWPRRLRPDGCGTPPAAGSGTVCNELARQSNLTVVLDETALPVKPAVGGACELLGIDPLYVANEGKFIAIVAPDEARRRPGGPAVPTAGRGRRRHRSASAATRPDWSCSSPPSGEPGSWTCWSGIRCPASAEAGRRFLSCAKDALTGPEVPFVLQNVPT